MISHPNTQTAAVPEPKTPIQEAPRPQFRSLKLERLEERVAPNALWGD